jgi:hypothetical protein
MLGKRYSRIDLRGNSGIEKGERRADAVQKRDGSRSRSAWGAVDAYDYGYGAAYVDPNASLSGARRWIYD